jgi:hypothetical protein
VDGNWIMQACSYATIVQVRHQFIALLN